MFRIVLYLLVFSFFSFGIRAQEAEKQFLNDRFESCLESESPSYFQETLISESGLWMVKVFYHPSGKLKMEGSYADENLELEEGLFTYYYRNGQIESRGMCSAGTKFGIWERFMWDGTTRPDRIYTGNTVDDLLNTKYRSRAASFPGGEEAMNSYLEENIRYPEPALNQGIEGEVEISFAVTAEGEILNPSITRSANYFLDKEAHRMVAEMPVWEPAMKGGHYHQSNFILPISFKLPE